MQFGLIDGIFRGKDTINGRRVDDYFVPPAMARQRVLAGLEPPYDPGPGSGGLAGWTGRIG